MSWYIFIFVTCLCCGATLSSVTDVVTCKDVKPIFEMKNMFSFIPEKPVAAPNLTICEAGTSCCTEEMEARLRLMVRNDFQNLLHHNSRSLVGLLGATAERLQEHIHNLAWQSQNKTSNLLGQVYQQLSWQAKRPTATLYGDLLRYLDMAYNASSSLPVTSFTTYRVPPELNLEDSVNTFFASIFPLVYHQAVNPHFRDYSRDYKACLVATTAEIQPFGDVPRQMGRGVARSLEAARVLLQALGLGGEALRLTDELLGDGSDACHSALLRMSYCSRCNGLPVKVKPCAGYCLNVLRGCLTQHAAELDLPWNGFVEATEKLIIAVQGQDTRLSLDLEDVFHSLDSKISEAIMYAMENAPMLERKVKKACGHAKWSHEDRHDGTSDELLHWTLTETAQTAGSREEESFSGQLRNLLSSLTKSRGFYANLAESLCSDDSFAETRDTADCWNGQRKGEYTKTVVAASVSAQKYNPELVWTQKSPDMRIAQLSDKLRHIRQVALMQLSLSPESDSYLEGSGSGRYLTDDEDHDEEGSGSGDDDSTPGRVEGEVPKPDPTAVAKPGPQGNGAARHSQTSRCIIALTFISVVYIYL